MESRIFSRIRDFPDDGLIDPRGYSLVELPIGEFLLSEFGEMDSRWIDENRRMGEETLGEIERSGIDVLAWYSSFRHHTVWGIFIRRSAIKGFAYQFATKTGEPLQHCLRAAYKVLYRHELFHFQVDCGYLKLDELASAHSLTGSGSYQKSRIQNKPWDDLEEALANARTLYKTRGIFKPELARIFKNSPHGYRDFGQYRLKIDFMPALDQLMSQPDSNLRKQPGIHGIGVLVDLEDSVLNGQHVPVYLLDT